MSNACPLQLWILEDDSDLRTMMSETAIRFGYQVQAFSTLNEAWSALDTVKGPESELLPDYVISDFLLPDGNSEKWMTHLREAFPDLPVICISGAFTDMVMAKLRQKGVQCFSKPLRMVKLFELIKPKTEALTG